MHGCTAEIIFEFVEAGQYQFVWDFSNSPAGRRDLRFWFDELADAKAVRGMKLDSVIDCVLPPARLWWPPGEICLRFVLSRGGLLRLRRALGLKTGHMHRESLAKFLRPRWIGAPISCHASGVSQSSSISTIAP